jgi:hypothetical protein
MGREIRKVEPTDLLKHMDSLSKTIVAAGDVRKSFSIGDCSNVPAANTDSSRKFYEQYVYKNY